MSTSIGYLRDVCEHSRHDDATTPQRARLPNSRRTSAVPPCVCTFSPPLSVYNAVAPRPRQTRTRARTLGCRAAGTWEHDDLMRIIVLAGHRLTSPYVQLLLSFYHSETDIDTEAATTLCSAMLDHNNAPRGPPRANARTLERNTKCTHLRHYQISRSDTSQVQFR